MDDQKIRNERFDKALKYVDKLLPLLPDTAHFETSEIMKQMLFLISLTNY